MNIERIEQALRLHINYVGKPSNGRYLEIMDSEACCYNGAPGIKISKLLDDYYKQVNVENLTEALDKLRKIDNINNNKQ
mgnify:CR=1 FL=1|tara:strand:+ start:1331 stop:1567 length:237 start_codon:yes stop_codon:yes gene_type:complete